MILDFWTDVEKFFGSIKDVVVKNEHNPVFWTIVVVGGLALFAATYSALHKE